MVKPYPTVERIQGLFSCENGELVYRTAPYRKPKMIGTKAGYRDKRDNMLYVNVDGKAFTYTDIVAIHTTGLPSPKKAHYKTLTVERLRSALSYNPETGEFHRTERSPGIKNGSRADYKEPCGYRYVTLDGNRHLAARLAWLYVHGEWPKRMLRFQDGNNQNCAIANLAYGKWDLSDPVQKRKYDKHSRRAKPEVYRKSQLKRDFGISLEQYQAMFVEQGGVCGICCKPETSERNGKRKWLAVDHDHADNTIRGLLCSKCNRLLGYADDSEETLSSAISYLEAHASKPKTNVIPLSARRTATSRSS